MVAQYAVVALKVENINPGWLPRRIIFTVSLMPLPLTFLPHEKKEPVKTPLKNAKNRHLL